VRWSAQHQASRPVVRDGDDGLALGDAIGVVDDMAQNVDCVAEGGFVLDRAIAFDEEDGAVDVFHWDNAVRAAFLPLSVRRIEQHVVVEETARQRKFLRAMATGREDGHASRPLPPQ